MIIIVALLLGLMLGLWLLTFVLRLLIFGLRLLIFVVKGACYLIKGLCLAVYATVTGLWNVGRRISQWRADRTAWQIAEYRAQQNRLAAARRA